MLAIEFPTKPTVGFVSFVRYNLRRALGYLLKPTPIKSLSNILTLKVFGSPQVKHIVILQRGTVTTLTRSARPVLSTLPTLLSVTRDVLSQGTTLAPSSALLKPKEQGDGMFSYAL